MFTFPSLKFCSLENNLFSINFIKENLQPRTKIALVALAIFSALATAAFVLYSVYRAKKGPPSKKSLPPKPSSLTKINPPSSSKPLTPSSSTSGLIPSTTSGLIPSMDKDLELAKQLEHEDNLKRDEELAQKLQEKYNKEPLPPPFKPSMGSSPKIPLSIIDPPTPPILKPPQPALTSSSFEQIRTICGHVATHILTDPTCSAVQAFAAIPPQTQQQVKEIFINIIREYESRYNPSRIPIGDPVPPYFASADGQQHKKYLSLLGMYNLILWGPNMIDHFKDKLFLGGKQHYDLNQGLNLFQHQTGTLVDLDTLMNVKNGEEALKKAEELIIKFGKQCGLKNADGSPLTAENVATLLPNRKLHLPSDPFHIHTAANHEDRSNEGVWKYITPAGVTQYYANVPNIDIVLITMALPYSVADLAWRAKESNGGTLSAEFFDDFFNRALSEKCFNHKTETFMEYYLDKIAKFEKALTPQEEARKNIINGKFGADLQKQNPEAVIKNALTRDALLGSLNDDDYTVTSLSLSEWTGKYTQKIIGVLIDKKLWKSTLYQTTEDDVYVLLDETCLQSILKDYYTSLKDSPF